MTRRRFLSATAVRRRALGLALAALPLVAIPTRSFAQAVTPAQARDLASQAGEDIKRLREVLLTFRDCKEAGAPKCSDERLQAIELPSNSFTRRMGTPLSSAKPDIRVVGNVDQFLVESHAAYKDLKAERNAANQVFESECKTTTDSCTALATAISAFDEVLADVKETVHALMAERDLYWPLAAVLRTAFVIADPGDEDTETFERSELSAKNTAAGSVDFELKHWRDEESPVDYSIDGRFGYAPVMAIGRRRGQTGPVATQKLIPLFQNGFIWEAGFKASLQMSNGELAAFYRTGQTRLSDLAVKLGSDENAQLADVVRNGVGRFAWRHDFGAQFRFYGVSMPLAHHDASRLLTPLLSAAAGIRLDERFNNEADLQSFPDSSNKRWFVRFSVNILKFLNASKEQPNDPMGVRIAVDYDGPMGGSKDLRFPSSTRLFIEGNADLLKLFGFDPKK